MKIKIKSILFIDFYMTKAIKSAAEKVPFQLTKHEKTQISIVRIVPINQAIKEKTRAIAI